MTAMTINPDVTMTSVTGSRLAYLRALLSTAKTRAMDLIRLGLAYAGKAAAAVQAVVPAPVLSLVGPVVLATKTGYHAALSGIAIGIKAVFSLGSWALRMGRKAIGWVGDRIVDGVAIFSLSASCKVADSFARFGDMVTAASTVAKTYLTGMGTSVNAAATSTTTVRTTTLVSGGVAVGIVSSHFAPVMTYTTLSSIPLVGKWLLLAVSGGWYSLAVIAGAALVATGFVLGRTVIADYRTKKAVADSAEPAPADAEPAPATTTPAPQAPVTPAAADETPSLVPATVLTEEEAQAEVARLEREMKAPIGSSPNKKHPRRK